MPKQPVKLIESYSINFNTTSYLLNQKPTASKALTRAAEKIGLVTAALFVAIGELFLNIAKCYANAGIFLVNNIILITSLSAAKAQFERLYHPTPEQASRRAAKISTATLNGLEKKEDVAGLCIAGATAFAAAGKVACKAVDQKYEISKKLTQAQTKANESFEKLITLGEKWGSPREETIDLMKYMGVVTLLSASVVYGGLPGGIVAAAALWLPNKINK